MQQQNMESGHVNQERGTEYRATRLHFTQCPGGYEKLMDNCVCF